MTLMRKCFISKASMLDEDLMNVFKDFSKTSWDMRNGCCHVAQVKIPGVMSYSNLLADIFGQDLHISWYMPGISTVQAICSLLDFALSPGIPRKACQHHSMRSFQHP